MRTLLTALILLASPVAAQDLHACKALHETQNIKSPFTVSGPVIVEKPALLLVGKAGVFTVDRANLGVDALWSDFGGHRRWIKDMKSMSEVGVCYDGDDVGNFHYFAGTEVTGEVPPPDGFERMTVPAGTYAVYTQQGLAWTIGNARWRIHQELLPEGYALADAPELEVYPEDYKPRTADATMEIWIPVVAE